MQHEWIVCYFKRLLYHQWGVGVGVCVCVCGIRKQMDWIEMTEVLEEAEREGETKYVIEREDKEREENQWRYVINGTMLRGIEDETRGRDTREYKGTQTAI